MANEFDWKKVLSENPVEEPRPEHLGPPPLSADELAELDAEAPPAPSGPAKKSVFDSIPPKQSQIGAPPAAAPESLAPMDSPAPSPKAKVDDDGPAIDPRTGEIMTEPVPNFKSPPDKADAAAHNKYKPATIDKSVHDIDVSDHRFDPVEGLIASEVSGQSDVLPVGDVHIDELLRDAIERKASDIHLTVGLPPMIRLDGELVPLPYVVLEGTDCRRLIYETLNDEQVQKFESTHELDFAYSIKGLARFRFNVYMQRGTVTGALRVIPSKIPSFETLGLPPVIREIAKRASGLILVTGPTGSGKSTTIASMIDDINEARQAHILTIEDPIEYLHRHKKCMVNQREMHADTFSFHNALRAVLREDPDIILVGELRDLETIEAALTLAETGHLVFGTLHTRNAPATIDRIVDVFPTDQQDQIRVLLGNTLEGVVSQQLLPKLGGGRCAAIEIMIGTPAIKNLIREGKTHQMYSSIETGGQLGMQTLDSSLAAHFRNGYCSYEECLMRAVDKESFARLARNAAA
ncbi:MAG TPA: PilT/PilU family type 4a pilus ATPase [Fimbriimonadaceae bacterium]|nr:PilT/PilU family type 4a pilus ATPase [Fimbriimonadaceae bacterium]